MYTINIPISKEEYIFLVQILLEYLNLKYIKEYYSIESDENYSEEKLKNLITKIHNVVFENCIYNDKDKEEIENNVQKHIDYNNKSFVKLLEKLEIVKEIKKTLPANAEEQEALKRNLKNSTNL